MDQHFLLFEEQQSGSSLHLVIQTMWDEVVVGGPEGLGVFLHEKVLLRGGCFSINMLFVVLIV